MAESDPPDKAGNVPHHPVMGPEEWYDSFREWTNDSFEIQGEVHFSNNGPSKVSHWGIVDFGPILGRVYRDDVEPNAYRYDLSEANIRASSLLTKFLGTSGSAETSIGVTTSPIPMRTH